MGRASVFEDRHYGRIACLGTIFPLRLHRLGGIVRRGDGKRIRRAPTVPRGRRTTGLLTGRGEQWKGEAMFANRRLSHDPIQYRLWLDTSAHVDAVRDSLRECAARSGRWPSGVRAWRGTAA